MQYFDDKTILITGGTGSFGRAFVESLLKENDPQSVRIYSRGELLQYETERLFPDKRLRFFIGDVRDKERLSRAMNGVDIVIHAAALKHVPICEYNPIEAVKTNINGAINIIDAAIDNNVDRVLGLSTDKAVHPVNLYGATKMVAEKLFVQGNSYSGDERDTKFSCVRYGNVVGSRGSVIPLFLSQKNTGKITITDERMTRFWLTLEEGVRFVQQSIERMTGGEIFVPRIPSMKVTDLARAIVPDAEVEIIGIRPGEKLHEILITEDEARHTKEYDTYYSIEPELKFWGEKTGDGGRPLPEGYRYASNTNTQWLDIDDLNQMVQSLHQ
ncbi:MAG: UDP-N-acetylglucosamine 4,6-dehydratase (inverting) [Methanoculleus sp. SDB]|nr:MAG: UDP-N-acetylglucosamine 4,6-dehydratase (inverting) [Methanoculleus sp. SDB]